jgi:hypothetical protein
MACYRADSLISTVISYGLNNCEFIPDRGRDNFLATLSRPALGHTQRLTSSPISIGGFLPGVYAAGTTSRPLTHICC